MKIKLCKERLIIKSILIHKFHRFMISIIYIQEYLEKNFFREEAPSD